jgi:inner membrane protein
MPTVMSHAVAGLAIASAFPAAPRRIWLLAAACAVLPDLDVAGFGYGIRYDDLLGHRGLSHSLLFAAALAALLRAAAFPRQMPGAPHVWTCLLLATASHGVLDALTDGGLGIAFFAPFDDGRYFLPWRPIQVSPISVRHFLSERGLAVLRSELLWVVLPSAALAGLAWVWRRRCAKKTP